MEQSFWQSRWAQGQIGFHLRDVNANLVRHAAAWLPPSASSNDDAPALAQQRILVPLAGKTVDVTWLAHAGAAVVAAEFVEQAVRSYFAEAGLQPIERNIDVGLRFVASLPRDGSNLQVGSVEFLVSDFFKLKAEHVGLLTAVYDRAALVAVNPERRAEYVAQLARLMPKGARLLLISFDHSLPSGPPFSMPAAEVIRLLTPHFELEQLADDDILEQEPRFKERGTTYLREQVWVGVRR